MEVADILDLLTKMRDKNFYFPERDALTIAIELVHSYDVWMNNSGFVEKIHQATNIERERIADGMRSWLTSKISDYELCLILGISKYDWNILIQEKQATWNSYIGSLVDACDNPNCKVKKVLRGTG
jgi:hypothetical protein